MPEVTTEYGAAYDAARAGVDEQIDAAADTLAAAPDWDRATWSMFARLLESGRTATELAALAAHALIRIAASRRPPLDLGGRRELTSGDREDIADDQRHVRAADL